MATETFHPGDPKPDRSDPARNAAAVTPNDSSDLGFTSRAIYCGGAGNLNVDMAGGGTVLFSGIVAGTIMPIAVTRVRSTNTTATNIVALW